MNIEYENRYIGTKKMISEFVHKISCRTTYVWGGVTWAISIPTLIVAFIHNDMTLMASLGICLFIATYTMLFSPPMIVRRMKETSRRVHNGNVYETVIQFGDNILLSEGSSTITFEYSQIMKVRFFKHSVALMIGKVNAILISPTCFTIGDFEGFQTFLREKCGNVKWCRR